MRVEGVLGFITTLNIPKSHRFRLHIAYISINLPLYIYVYIYIYTYTYMEMGFKTGVERVEKVFGLGFWGALGLKVGSGFQVIPPASGWEVPSMHMQAAPSPHVENTSIPYPETLVLSPKDKQTLPCSKACPPHSMSLSFLMQQGCTKLLVFVQTACLSIYMQ